MVITTRIKLKELREKSGMTQTKLAELSGVKQGIISMIESGDTKSPRLDTMMAIAHVLNCKIDDLISFK